MKLKAVIDGGLQEIEPSDLPEYCRPGIYICCKNGGGHSHNDVPSTCGYHLWVYVGPRPVPHHSVLLARIRAEVPHVNGDGVHSE